MKRIRLLNTSSETMRVARNASICCVQMPKCLLQTPWNLIVNSLFRFEPKIVCSRASAILSITIVKTNFLSYRPRAHSYYVIPYAGSSEQHLELISNNLHLIIKITASLCVNCIYRFFFQCFGSVLSAFILMISNWIFFMFRCFFFFHDIEVFFQCSVLYSLQENVEIFIICSSLGNLVKFGSYRYCTL